MRKLLSFIFLLPFLVSACNTPASNAAQPVVIENTVLPTQSVQFTPIPTFTAKVQPTAGLSTSTPVPVPSRESNVIKFAANGTYVNLTDTIASGASKTYSINAMKGQIMSVSALPQIPEGDWGYLSLKIKGEDGNDLCPKAPDTECLFWRGLLPASQDYFVTLTPNGNVPQFILRVAVNPPGKDVQYFQYANPSTGVSLTYPDTFAPSASVYGNYKITPELTLHLIDSKTYEKTNLSEVYLFISSSSDSQVVATCTEPNQMGGSPEQIVGNEVVNGYTFVHSTSEGAGAGNYYEQEVYRLVNKKVCHEVIYFIHYTNAGNYPPGTITEFDRDALTQKFLSIFNTFTIK